MLAVCAIAQGAQPSQKPANKSAAPDIEFLEYLGTLESEDENWTDVAEIERQKPTATSSGHSSSDAKVKTAPSPPQRVDSSHER